MKPESNQSGYNNFRDVAPPVSEPRRSAKEMSAQANNLLKLYLGTDQNGGYQPVGCEDRLKRAFPHDHEEKKKLIARYLDEDHSPDWKHELLEEMNIFEGVLKKKFPELEAVVIRSLANRFSYGWR